MPIFHGNCLIIHSIIWGSLAGLLVQVVHSLPPAAVDMCCSCKWEGCVAELLYVVA